MSYCSTAALVTIAKIQKQHKCPSTHEWIKKNVGVLNTHTHVYIYINGASQVVLVVKNLPANAGDKRHEFDLWVRRIPWRRAWQPTPVFLPGESLGQRSLAGYSP